MGTKIRLTADDLWKLGTSDDVRRELVDGEILEMTSVGGLHGLVAGNLSLGSAGRSAYTARWTRRPS